MNDHVSLRTVFRWAVGAGLGLLAVWWGASLLYAVRDVLVVATVALFIAVGLDPAVRLLNRRGVPRSLAVTLIFVVAFVGVLALIAAVVPPLVREATSLSRDLPGYIDAITERSRSLREFGDRFGLTANLRELAADLPGIIGANLLGFVRGLFGALFTGLTVTVLTIYFMADLPRLRSGVVRLFPARVRPRARSTVDLVVDKVGAYMIGNLVISLIAGFSTFFLLTAVGAPFALPLALVVAVTDLIPMIGATLGAVICVVVTAVAAPLWPTTAIVALFFILYQQLENYLIAPRVMRNAVDLPAVAVLLAALIGGTVLGLVGALMAIPVAAVIKVLGSERVRQMDAAEAASVGAGGARPDARQETARGDNVPRQTMQDAPGGPGDPPVPGPVATADPG